MSKIIDIAEAKKKILKDHLYKALVADELRKLANGEDAQ